MQLNDLIAKLTTADELATSRVGLLGMMQAPSSIDPCAEKISLDSTTLDAGTSACELVLADINEASLCTLPVALRRLTRDGLLIATVPTRFSESAVRIVADSDAADWVALLHRGGVDSFLVAALGIHPAELGTAVTEHLVHTPRAWCLQLPQNRADRARRRFVRRRGRDRLLALAERLSALHGAGVRRVVIGIEMLIAERPPVPSIKGNRAGMFVMPDLEMNPWPDPTRSSRLRQIVETCERHAPGVRSELRELIASRSFSAYLPDAYNREKFQLLDPDHWQALRLVDWRSQMPDLPAKCLATRELISRLAPHLSGEVTVLRIAPRTALPPHFDDNDYEQYIHVGITVPAGCALRVAGQARAWEEGRAMVFTPAFLHEAWNLSDRPRDVFAVDIWHPDLSEVEIAALRQVRAELEALRLERGKQPQ